MDESKNKLLYIQLNLNHYQFYKSNSFKINVCHHRIINWLSFEQVGRIPFDEQLRNFEITLNQITGNIGADNMATQLSRCIFFIGMGSNDYLNNYLMPNYNTRNQYNGQQYADLLVQTYNHQLTVRFFLSLIFTLKFKHSSIWL